MELWYAWGDEADTQSVPPRIAALLENAMDVDPRAVSSVVPLAEVRLPASTLAPSVVESLAAIVGAEHVRTAAEDRIRHARGKSTSDLLRMRAGDAAEAPDAVVLPG